MIEFFVFLLSLKNLKHPINNMKKIVYFSIFRWKRFPFFFLEIKKIQKTCRIYLAYNREIDNKAKLSIKLMIVIFALWRDKKDISSMYKNLTSRMFNVSAWHWHLSEECVRMIIHVAAWLLNKQFLSQRVKECKTLYANRSSILLGCKFFCGRLYFTIELYDCL